MKIYYVEPVELPGIVAHSVQIENNLRELGNFSDLVLISYVNKKSFSGLAHVKFKRPSFFKKFIPLSVFHFILKLRRYNFEKNSFLFTRSPLVALLLKKKFKKTILEVHDVPSIKKNFLHFLLFELILFKIPLIFLKKCNIVAISNGIKRRLVKLGFNKNLVSVLPDGVDLNKFDLKMSKNNARRKLNLPENKKIVLYTGSMQKWKGHRTFLKSSKRLSENIQLVVVGGNKKQINKLKKEFPKIIFVGFVNNKLVPIYLKSSDVLVIPNSGRYNISKYYTSPLKLFEYMASKRPIIASNLPSLREIVSEKEVYFFKPDNSVDLCEKIDELLKDKDKQKRISNNAFNLAKKFTWKNRAREIIQIFKK